MWNNQPTKHLRLTTLAICYTLLTGCGKPEKAPLANPTPEAKTCGANHRLVGTKATLTTKQHGVRGVITVLSECAIRIDNFSYDGGGPNVHVYGAVGGDFRTGFNMSDALQGRTYQNESLTFFLPTGKTLSDLGGVSIWCSDFQVDFGSATFK